MLYNHIYTSLKTQSCFRFMKLTTVDGKVIFAWWNGVDIVTVTCHNIERMFTPHKFMILYINRTLANFMIVCAWEKGQILWNRFFQWRYNEKYMIFYNSSLTIIFAIKIIYTLKYWVLASIIVLYRKQKIGTMS